ncbi:hypothetical protein AVEN_53387-1 [Araneus ventricosus]|uniref:Uncharacterized protein n=1 Tax=Araneus ventricosus TaxID=182803 RepID=A0A4Y2AA36_ARAVE|nr:hypothetical protein AVEN_53387-1 [Araneus ventricosus]
MALWQLFWGGGNESEWKRGCVLIIWEFELDLGALCCEARRAYLVLFELKIFKRDSWKYSRVPAHKKLKLNLQTQAILLRAVCLKPAYTELSVKASPRRILPPVIPIEFPTPIIRTC